MKAVIKALIEGKDGLYIIRIYGKEGRLYDVYVVDEVELTTCDQDIGMSNSFGEGKSGFENKKEESMSCPHLNLWRVITCKIGDRIYIPSIYQLREYCETRWHKRCPFNIKRITEKNEEENKITV